MWFKLGLLLAWIAAGLLTPFFGFWPFQIWALGSPLGATLAAFVLRERWPVVHPILGIFYTIPTLLVLLRILRSWIQTGRPLDLIDWMPWLGWSLALGVAIAAALVLGLRRHIDREWAAVGSLCVAIVLSAWTLSLLNINLPQRATYTAAAVISANPGMVRSSAWSVTIAPAGPFRSPTEHIPGSRVWRAANEGQPICLCVYSGALGWSWASLTQCDATSASQPA